MFARLQIQYSAGNCKKGLFEHDRKQSVLEAVCDRCNSLPNPRDNVPRLVRETCYVRGENVDCDDVTTQCAVFTEMRKTTNDGISVVFHD